MKNDDILNSRLYTIVNYITYFFVTNILFLLMISPLIIYWIIFENNMSSAVLLLLSILLGPAITTLLSIMGKLIRERDISPVKDFFHFYKLNLLQSLLVAIVVNMLISIVYFDINYFSSNGNKGMTYLFLFMLVLILLNTFYIYPIISRYNLKFVDLFKISISLMYKKFYISLSSVSIIIIVLGLLRFTKLSLIGLLFGASIISYIVIKIQIKTLDGLEEKITHMYN